MTKEELLTKKISAISLGCDKNRVDLEKMLFRLKKYGFEVVSEEDEAQILIVNTCAFIEPAKQEAVANIFQALRLKTIANVEKVIVTGCLPERYIDDLLKDIPEVDAYVRLRDNVNICNIIEELYGMAKSKQKPQNGRVLTAGSTYAYLKIADGCNNVCSYCTIPRIRGRYISEKIEDLVDEAKNLAQMGVKELVLVAQDTTSYGNDIYGKPSLIDLCKQLIKIKEIKWIRIHYAYPELIDDELLSFIQKEEKMCKYLDIPLQHIDDSILKSMRRRLNEEDTRKLITKIRTVYPEIKIRSTFIVGYPGETGAQFKKLCSFLEEVQLDYVGFFPYYREEGTVSSYLKGQVHQYIKKMRLKKVQKLQSRIAEKKLWSLIGQEICVLVDEFSCQSGYYIGHANFMSKGVDFNVKIEDNNDIEIGSFKIVRITDFDGEYLKGEIV